MPRQPNPKRIETLEQQLERVARKLRKARADEKEQARSDDARRKIISGALDENHALANPKSDFAKIHVGLLKQQVRLEDRHLFADIFRALLPAHEAETLLADGEAAREAAKQAKAEKKAAQPGSAVTEAAE